MKYQVNIRAEKLPSDVLVGGSLLKRKLSAYAVVSHVSGVGDVLGIKRTEFGRTEAVWQCNSPEWATIAVLRHTPHADHRIAVDVYHSAQKTDFHTRRSIHKRRSSDLSQALGGISFSSNHSSTTAEDGDDDGGTCVCGVFFEVERVLKSPGSCISIPIRGSDGSIFVRLEESARLDSDEQRRLLNFQVRGHCLSNIRYFMDRPDFFFEVHRKQREASGDTWGLVYRSDCVLDSLRPLWKADTVDLECLCNNDLDRIIRISIFDCDDFGKRTFLGSFETTVAGFIDAKSDRGNCDKNKAFIVLKKSKPKGKFIVVDAALHWLQGASSPSFPRRRPEPMDPCVEEQSSVEVVHSGLPSSPSVVVPIPPPEQSAPTFDEYIDGGCELEMCVAIDFTSSNGDYRVPGTPHYIDESKNDYEWVISVVGSVVAKFNQRQSWPVWGFGASYNGNVHHIFQCGNSKTAEGVDGVIKAYRSIFDTQPVPAEPTCYDAVIQAAASHSSKAKKLAEQRGKLSYTILLVLTNGTESDLESARATLMKASRAPLSIVFVHMNGKHFSISCSDQILVFGGRSFCSFVGSQSFCDGRDPKLLARSVFSQLPEQLVDYFQSTGPNTKK